MVDMINTKVIEATGDQTRLIIIQEIQVVEAIVSVTPTRTIDVTRHMIDMSRMEIDH